MAYSQDPGPGRVVCASESISTVLSQSGARVTAHIMPSCYGSLGFSGTVDGSLLT